MSNHEIQNLQNVIVTRMQLIPQTSPVPSVIDGGCPGHINYLTLLVGAAPQKPSGQSRRSWHGGSEGTHGGGWPLIASACGTSHTLCLWVT